MKRARKSYWECKWGGVWSCITWSILLLWIFFLQNNELPLCSSGYKLNFYSKSKPCLISVKYLIIWKPYRHTLVYILIHAVYVRRSPAVARRCLPVMEAVEWDLCFCIFEETRGIFCRYPQTSAVLKIFLLPFLGFFHQYFAAKEILEIIHPVRMEFEPITSIAFTFLHFIMYSISAKSTIFRIWQAQNFQPNTPWIFNVNVSSKFMAIVMVWWA